MSADEFCKVVAEEVEHATGSRSWLSKCVHYSSRLDPDEPYSYYGYKVKGWAELDRFGQLKGLNVPVGKAPELVRRYEKMKAEGEL